MMPSKPFTVWITGLSASGKTTLGSALSRHLTGNSLAAVWLSGDSMWELASLPENALDRVVSEKTQGYDPK